MVEAVPAAVTAGTDTDAGGWEGAEGVAEGEGEGATGAAAADCVAGVAGGAASV